MSNTVKIHEEPEETYASELSKGALAVTKHGKILLLGTTWGPVVVGTGIQYNDPNAAVRRVFPGTKIEITVG